jgi:hypothetical protein
MNIIDHDLLLMIIDEFTPILEHFAGNREDSANWHWETT